jgi:hypothetical protein
MVRQSRKTNAGWLSCGDIPKRRHRSTGLPSSTRYAYPRFNVIGKQQKKQRVITLPRNGIIPPID